jgi:histidinol-phosphate phosphatase family protein
MEAVILAGGKGARLRELTRSVPKPMLRILDKPVLQYQVENLRRCGIRDIVMVTGYLGHEISDHFGDGSAMGVRIRYVQEETALGTAGSLARLRPELSERFIIIYGDLVLDVDFNRFIAFHRAREASISLIAHPTDHPADCDLVVLGRDDVVQRILKKNQPRTSWYNNCVNAGVFLCERRTLRHLRPGRVQDMEEHLLEPTIRGGQVYAYRTSEYVKDMGTPERYARVREHLARGIVGKRSLSRPQKAIFLDRDGTINEYVGLLTSPDELKIRDEVYEGIGLINNSEFLAIVISNQSVIARNLCSIEELEDIHRKLETMLGQHCVYVDRLYYCPHHPARGYEGENRAYKIPCDCRKPNTGLIRQAAAACNIDLGSSYFVGDTTVDIQAGKNAGLRTILLSTGEGGKDGKYSVTPDFRAADLLAAVQMILSDA